MYAFVDRKRRISMSNFNPNTMYSIEMPPTGFTIKTSPSGTSLVTKKEQRPVFFLPNYQSPFDLDDSFQDYLDEQSGRSQTPCSAPILRDSMNDDDDPSSFFIRQDSKTVFVFPSPQPACSPNLQNEGSVKPIQRSDGVCLLRSISFTAKQAPRMSNSQIFSSFQASNRRMSLSMPQLYPGLSVYAPPTPAPRDYSDESDEFSDSGLTDNGASSYVKHPTWSWRNKFGFFILGICQALGLSNVWRFPYFCYTNGGGSFLLAYLILLIACSTPFLCMEFAVGQFTQDHAVSALKKICPIMKGVGVAGILTSFWLTTLYSVLIAWSMFYLFNSLYSTPRWTSCNYGWNTLHCHSKPGSPRTVDPVSSTEPSLYPAVPSWFESTRNTTLSVLDTPSTSISTEMTSPVAFLSSVGKNVTIPSEEFFRIKLLEVSNGIENLGELRFELLAVIIFTWVFIFVALRKPSILVGHTRYILAIFPHLIFVIFAVRSLLLEGSFKGVRYFFKPKWEDLQNIKVWLYALAQTFHSLGVVLGFGIAVGSCNKLNNNMMRDTMVFMAANVYTQVVVSIAVFATIGHLSHVWKRPLETTVEHDPGLVLVVFSEIVAGMPVPTLWSLMFFTIFIGVAIDSQVLLMQTVISALKEAFKNAIKKYFHGHILFTLFLCVASLFCSIPFVTQAGIYFFQLTDHYISVLSVVSLALVEIVTVSWIYGAGKLSNVIYQMVNKKPSFYFVFSWYLLGPLSILACIITLIVSGWDLKIRKNYSYPSWSYLLGWLLVSASLVFLPIFAIAAYRKAPRTNVITRLNSTLLPCPEPEPQTIWEDQPLFFLKSPPPSTPKFDRSRNGNAETKF